jgi:hypothetical protein
MAAALEVVESRRFDDVADKADIERRIVALAPCLGRASGIGGAQLAEAVGRGGATDKIERQCGRPGGRRRPNVSRAAYPVTSSPK